MIGLSFYIIVYKDTLIEVKAICGYQSYRSNSVNEFRKNLVKAYATQPTK
jgi:hypothetical protein